MTTSVSPKDPLTILYGSQTGNAQSIAESIHDEALRRGYNSILKELNSFKSLDPPLEERVVAVFVCSTTGNGDPPENCSKFWRYLKRRTHSNALLSKLKYAVLGLGDTNYDKFCYMGKELNTRLRELGGTSVYPLACADEGTGKMEDIVEPWIENIWPVIESILGKANKLEAHKPTATVSPGLSISDYVEQLKLSDHKVNISSDLRSVDQFVSGDTIKLIEKIPEHEIPNLRSFSHRIKFVIGTKYQTSIDTDIDQIEAAEAFEYSSRNPFFASVENARYLTCGGSKSERRVIHLQFNLKNSRIHYKPGDAVGIKCQNPAEWVDSIISRVGNTLPPGCDSQTLIRNESEIPHVPSNFSMYEALRSHMDLQSIPKKSTLRMMAEHCTSEMERSILLYLSTRTVGNSLYKEFILNQGLTFVETLAMFPSCAPPFDKLVCHLPPLPPRYYSASTSNLVSNDRLAIAFSVCHSVSGSGVKRKGLCTHWLEGLLAPLLAGTESRLGVKVPIFLRQSTNFSPPPSVENPLIMVGPGTGVAPFIGFLEHRDTSLELIKRSCSVDSRLRANPNDEDMFSKDAVGETWLFFGCRHSEGELCDWIYKEEMMRHLSTGTLSQLCCAFSRDGESKVYVQHKMLEHAKKIADLALNRSSYFFVCGDGTRMARDIEATFVDILRTHGNFDGDSEVRAFVEQLKSVGKYVVDVWSL